MSYREEREYTAGGGGREVLLNLPYSIYSLAPVQNPDPGSSLCIVQVTTKRQNPISVVNIKLSEQLK
jgi:hypothetical protein